MNTAWINSKFADENVCQNHALPAEIRAVHSGLENVCFGAEVIFIMQIYGLLHPNLCSPKIRHDSKNIRPKIFCPEIPILVAM
jgi:hypothetical protein